MQRRLPLSALVLKLIALVAMTADHVGWLFVSAYTPLGFVLHLIGRLTAPIMAFFIAEGYYHTKDLARYVTRLSVFALLSHVPFRFYMTGSWTLSGNTSVMYTLLLGLLALIVARHEKLHWLLKAALIAGLIYIAQWGDWQGYMVLWVLGFGLLRKQRRGWALAWSGGVTVYVYLQALWGKGYPASFWGQSAFNLGGLLVLPLLLLYNGQPGKIRLKYLFYFYYPLHLIVIRLLAMWPR